MSICPATTDWIPKTNGRATSSYASRDDWAEPLSLESEAPPVAPFREEFLPESFRRFCVDTSERMQVPLDYPGTMALINLAGAVNRRACIQPKEHDFTWLCVPNLWGGIIGPPGVLKSPTMNAMLRPLQQIEADWHEEYRRQKTDYERQKEEFDLCKAAWKEQYKSSHKRQRAIPTRPDDEPEPPRARRLIVNDSSYQKLHQIMSENPQGLYAVWDELTGWLTQLDQPGREGERQFYLQAWNGNSSYTVDRIARGTVDVPHCCISLVGGITPARLRSYLADALKDGPTNDGLIQRFQLLIWPDVDSWKEVDRPPDGKAIEVVRCVFSKLVEMGSDNPLQLRFSTDAQAVFRSWFAALEIELRSDELHAAKRAHLSKYRSLMPSLALLFQLADAAAGKGDYTEVSLTHTERAIQICNYARTHAWRVYSCVVTPQRRAMF